VTIRGSTDERAGSEGAPERRAPFWRTWVSMQRCWPNTRPASGTSSKPTRGLFLRLRAALLLLAPTRSTAQGPCTVHAPEAGLQRKITQRKTQLSFAMRSVRYRTIQPSPPSKSRSVRFSITLVLLLYCIANHLNIMSPAAQITGLKNAVPQIREPVPAA
jgi:hypothetical protein